MLLNAGCYGSVLLVGCQGDVGVDAARTRRVRQGQHREAALSPIRQGVK